MPAIHLIADKLIAQIQGYQSCLIAFSGGVDSTVVAKAAQLALGDQATAVTSVSPSLAERERREARQLAQLIGIRHREIETEEFLNPVYLANSPDRCYHCKSELYRQMAQLCLTFPDAIIVNGTNADDLQDYRPGLRAADEHRVRSPLVDCNLGKSEVRSLAAFFALPNWDKPAMPCLSSRIAYGEQVTPDRLRMVELGEQFLYQHGFSQVRVRYHQGDLARVEVRAEDVSRIALEPFRTQLSQRLQELGFRFVTLDLQGFRSGSLNTLVPLDVLRRDAAAE